MSLSEKQKEPELPELSMELSFRGAGWDVGTQSAVGTRVAGRDRVVAVVGGRQVIQTRPGGDLED